MYYEDNGDRNLEDSILDVMTFNSGSNMGQVQQDDRVDLTNYSQQTLSNCMILGDLTNIRNSCLKDARSQRMSILRKKRNSIETENSEGVSQNREQAESFVSSTQNNSSYLPNPISFTNLLQSMGSPHQEGKNNKYEFIYYTYHYWYILILH